MNSQTATSFDELLRHAGFLRELAQALCADAGSADDLVQDVWVRTLRSGPQTYDTPRGWLTTVARRLANNMRRGNRRRITRERSLPPAPGTPSPEEVLAAEQVRERVVRAVLAAPEALREVLLLRFWEALPPRAIAQRLSIPGATVRTRLSRGLEWLRTSLDREHGGDRSQWRLALAAFVAPAAAPGLLSLNQLVGSSLAIAAGALALIVWWPTAEPVLDAGAVTRGARTVAAATTTTQPEDAGSSPQREAAAAAGEPLDTTREPRVFPAAREPGAVFGTVVDMEGNPVAGVTVEAKPVVGNAPPGLVIADDRGGPHTTVADADGRFRFDALAAGPFALTARRGEIMATARTVVGARATEGPVQLQLRRVATMGEDVRIHVVDAAGLPVEGALVRLFAWSRRDPDPEAAERSQREPLFEGRTDAAGQVAVVGRGAWLGVVWVTADDGRVGLATLSLGNGGVEDPIAVRVQLDATGAVDVRLRGAPAASLAGAVLSLHALGSYSAYGRGEAHGLGGGRELPYELEGDRLVAGDLPAGTYAVSLHAPRAGAQGLRLVTKPMVGWDDRAMPNSIELPRLQVAAGRTTNAEFEVAAGGAIRGTVVCGDRPVLAARVRAVLAPRSGFPAGFVKSGVHVWRLDSEYENAPGLPIATVVAHTDAHGRYELCGLTPGLWRVEVAASGLSFDRRQDVEVAADAAVELRHELARAGVLQVALRDASYMHFLGVLRPGDRVPVMLAGTRDDFATFPGLAPGRYHVARCPDREQFDPVVVGEGEVVAGRTTWLDLRAASVGSVVTGRVLAGSRPVAGARVSVNRSVITGDDGSFRLESGFQPRFDLGENRGWILRVSLNGLGWVFVPDVAGPVKALDTVLQLGEHSVDIAVSGAEGRAVPASWEVYWNAAEGAQPAPGAPRLRSIQGHGETGADGCVHLGPFPPGRLAGHVAVGGLNVRLATSLPCSKPLRIVDPPRAKLRVRVTVEGWPERRGFVWAATWFTRAPETAKFEQLAAAETFVEARTDDEGFVVLDVAAGEVGVRCDGMQQDDPGRRLRIEAGATVNLEIDLR